MSVFSQTEENKVQLRYETGLGSTEFDEGFFVALCCDPGIGGVRDDGVDVTRGDWNRVKKGLLDHSIVALSVRDRNKALVNHEDVDGFPIDLPTPPSQFHIEMDRRLPSRQSNRKDPSFRNRRSRHIAKARREEAEGLLFTLKNKK